MARAWQSEESGKRNYPGSPLQERNHKLKRAARISPARQGTTGCEKLALSLRVMTAAEYVANGEAGDAQVDAGREPHLLVADPYNDGEFLPVAIYDVAIKQPPGLCEFDLHAGPVLVKPDTLIYWK